MALATIDVGTGGAPAGLIQRLPGSPEMNMLGIPLVDTEHCQAAGTVGDILLTDLSQYLIADDRAGAEVSSSIHLNFDYGKSVFRIMKYVGGQPRWSAAFTRQNSTNTYSSVVSLAARSA
jgi:HK97 family phage major capsid protein